MVSREFEEELRRRVARLELLMAAALLRPGGEIGEETRNLLKLYFHDVSRRDDRYSDLDFDYLADFAFRARDLSMERVEGAIAELEHRRAGLSEQLDRNTAAISERLDTMDEAVYSLKREQGALSASTHEWLAVQSLGIDTPNVRLSRFIPLRVYLSETPDSAVEDVNRAVAAMIEAFGFEFSDEFPPVRGSWFKKWFAKTTEIMTQPEMAERLEKLERALELKGLGQPQAEIDAKQAAAVAQLMKAVKDIPNAAIQAGSILLIKLQSLNGPTIQVRTLTQTELIHLENNQKLLASPADLLERLSEICQAGGYARGSIGKIDGKKRTKRTSGIAYVPEAPRPEQSQQADETLGASGKTSNVDDESKISERDLKRLPPPSVNDRGTG